MKLLGPEDCRREEKGADKEPWGGLDTQKSDKEIRALRLRSGSKEGGKQQVVLSHKAKGRESQAEGLSSCEVCPYWNLGAYSM